ncbi:hypothetical protein ZOSMA_29G00330 [Zostera marina]|uniref:Homeobox domain-containing protein n=1 Tax=Zostera marina TaxID=29655 RepID=A0A0K9PBM8_ZOSMR|nr:hypothetical protein ZOSMA_29G00330 [Zostera marina]
MSMKNEAADGDFEGDFFDKEGEYEYDEHEYDEYEYESDSNKRHKVDELSTRRKKKPRHTHQQVGELEAFFKECPSPDFNQIISLSKKLGLKMKQVIYWFQNRRSKMKVILGHQENVFLREKNDRLRYENMLLIEAPKTPMCKNCKKKSIDDLRIKNAHLKEQLERVRSLIKKSIDVSSSSFNNFPCDGGFKN